MPQYCARANIYIQIIHFGSSLVSYPDQNDAMFIASIVSGAETNVNMHVMDMGQTWAWDMSMK